MRKPQDFIKNPEVFWHTLRDSRRASKERSPGRPCGNMQGHLRFESTVCSKKKQPSLTGRLLFLCAAAGGLSAFAPDKKFKKCFGHVKNRYIATDYPGFLGSGQILRVNCLVYQPDLDLLNPPVQLSLIVDALFFVRSQQTTIPF